MMARPHRVVWHQQLGSQLHVQSNGFWIRERRLRLMSASVGSRCRDGRARRGYLPPIPPSQRSGRFGGMRLTRIRITAVEPKYV